MYGRYRVKRFIVWPAEKALFTICFLAGPSDLERHVLVGKNRTVLEVSQSDPVMETDVLSKIEKR